jgi:Ca-activated chloride channel family protein
VSFKAPILLLALLLVPVAIAAYVQLDRRRRRAAEAFAAPKMLPSIAPLRPRWRRHAPIALYVAALAGLAIAVARPEASVAVPEEHASVVLATDQSGSMAATDIEPSRLEAARKAADQFLDQVPGKLRVGSVVFNNAVRSVQAPATDRGEVRRALRELRPTGGTAAGEALAASLALLEPLTKRRPGVRGDRRAPAAIVLLSDGASTHGRDPLPFARAAAKRKIPIYTVALGTASGTIQVRTPSGGTELRSVPPDPSTLKRIAQISGGEFYAAADELELDAVYKRLGSRVSMTKERREITVAFVGAASALLLIGAALSLRWFGRLP